MTKPSQQFPVHQLPPFLLGEIARAVVAARGAGRDIIDFSQLNPSLGAPGAAIEKLVQAALQPHNHRYSSSQGILKLREAISGYYQRRFGVELDVEREITVTLGTKQALSHLLFATASPDDSIILPMPAYPIHTALVALSGAHSISVPLPLKGGAVVSSESEDFFSKLKEVCESTWPRPMMCLVSFPHNPTGAVATRCFFERLVEVGKQEGLYLVHDFAYADLSYDGWKTPSLLEIPGAKDIAVECFSFSKGLGMPGWRVGSCVGSEPLISALKKVKSYLDCGLFQPLQIGAVKALEVSESVFTEASDVYRARRDALVSGLTGLGFEADAPKGGLFVWARLPESARAEGSMKISHRLLDEALVAVCPGVGFDPHADEYLRFSLMENESRTRAAITRMAELFGRS